MFFTQAPIAQAGADMTQVSNQVAIALLVLVTIFFVALLVTSLLLRALPVAMLNFCLCLIVCFFLEPWSAFSSVAVASRNSIAGKGISTIWVFFLAASILTLIFCAATQRKKGHRRGRRHRRRRQFN